MATNSTQSERETIVQVDAKIDQLAFDKLPPAVRIAVANLDHKISPVTILDALQSGMPEDVVIERLQMQSARIADEYYRSLDPDVQTS